MAKWSLRVIEGRWVNVGVLSLAPSDCPVWECCVPDGDVNYRPLFGAGSRCFEAKAAVIQDPLSLMAELRSPFDSRSSKRCVLVYSEMLWPCICRSTGSNPQCRRLPGVACVILWADHLS